MLSPPTYPRSPPLELKPPNVTFRWMSQSISLFLKVVESRRHRVAAVHPVQVIGILERLVFRAKYLTRARCGVRVVLLTG